MFKLTLVATFAKAFDVNVPIPVGESGAENSFASPAVGLRHADFASSLCRETETTRRPTIWNASAATARYWKEDTTVAFKGTTAWIDGRLLKERFVKFSQIAPIAYGTGTISTKTLGR